MELEGDGDHLESVKRDSDSDPGLEEGKKIHILYKTCAMLRSGLGQV